ncbi:NUDIX hydrolase, partial [Butyricicoccus sp. 1XD8-22]
NELTKVKPDENSAIQWMGLEEAIEKSTEPEMKVVYKKLNEKLNVYSQL